MKKSNGKKSLGKIIGLSAGAVALGATAYYFLGPKGKRHQKSAKQWVVEAKKKVIKEIEKGKEMTESIYGKIVDDILRPYVAKGAIAEEVSALSKALKKDWKNIVRASKENLKKSSTATKKTATEK